jgi:hypothetical protein
MSGDASGGFEVDRAPRLGGLRPTVMGWRVRVGLHDGQIPDDSNGSNHRLAPTHVDLHLTSA